MKSLPKWSAVLARYNTPWTIENVLRKKGFILEGFNPDRDVYERVYKIGPVKFVRDLHTFSKSTKTKIIANPVKSAYEVTRGEGTMVFSSIVDLKRRLHRLKTLPSVNAEAPYLVKNLRTGVCSFMAANRLDFSATMRGVKPRLVA